VFWGVCPTGLFVLGWWGYVGGCVFSLFCGLVVSWGLVVCGGYNMYKKIKLKSFL